MEPVILETPRLILRPLVEGDIEAVYRACQDEDTQRWTTVPSPYLWSNAEVFVRQVCPDGWRDETLFNLGSFTRDGGRLVSSVGVLGRRWRENGVAEVGYWTAKDQRGHGYTAEAVSAMCRWAFEVLGVQRMEWMAVTGNVGSRAVAERAGFRFEGTLRSALVHRGERLDGWIGALLPSDLA
jgi:RimJ/RimL family protein N-acetyltransferase